MNTKKVKKSKLAAQITGKGAAHIKASTNNIIISMTNHLHQVVSWASAGKMGFRGAKKSTPFAAQIATKACAKVAADLGIKEVGVYVKGVGAGREAAIRAINDTGISVTTIYDVTPQPHGGCRPPKIRKP